jgi:hypothetical protein
MFSNCLENRAVYEITWKNLEPDRTQMTIWRMGIECWVTKATDKPYYCNNGCTNTPQCNVLLTLPVWFQIYSDYFPIRNSPNGFCSGSTRCFL